MVIFHEEASDDGSWRGALPTLINVCSGVSDMSSTPKICYFVQVLESN